MGEDITHKVYRPPQHRDLRGRFSIKSWLLQKWHAFVALVKFALKVGACLAVIALLVIGAYLDGTHEVSAQVSYVTAPAPIAQEAPVLARIADCESGVRKANGKAVPGSGRQFLPNGQIVTNVNKNGTVDMGMYGINTNVDNIKQMAKLKLDPLTEEGNHAFAKWIYENVGTGPWYSSQDCWL